MPLISALDAASVLTPMRCSVSSDWLRMVTKARPTTAFGGEACAQACSSRISEREGLDKSKSATSAAAWFAWSALPGFDGFFQREQAAHVALLEAGRLIVGVKREDLLLEPRIDSVAMAGHANFASRDRLDETECLGAIAFDHFRADEVGHLLPLAMRALNPSMILRS